MSWHLALHTLQCSVSMNYAEITHMALWVHILPDGVDAVWLCEYESECRVVDKGTVVRSDRN